MLDSDKTSFHELMLGLGEIYGKDITTPLLRIYFNAFDDLTIEQVSKAVTMHTTSGDESGSFFPKPSDFIRQLNGTNKQKEQGVEDKSALAWAAIESQIKRKGSYGNLELEDRQALGTVQGMGGWKQLCLCTTDELVWKRKEFMDSYACYERTPLEALPAKLAGRLEISNHKQDGGSMKSLIDGLKNFESRINDNSTPKLIHEDERDLIARDLLENYQREYIKNWLASQTDEVYRDDMRKRINAIKNQSRMQ